MNVSNILKKQRGSISILGAAAIAVSLTGFMQVLDYGNAKILDKELDNYARSIASTALRSELAITKAGLEGVNGQPPTITVDQTDLITNAILAQVEQKVGESITKEITFGNFASSEICNSEFAEIRKGCFIPLESNQNNPRASEEPLDFSAVAVKLVSSSSFMGVYTPEGRALYGMSKENAETDSGCYCKNRYTACLDMDLTAADLSPIPSAESAAIAVKGSDARKNYCDYGYTDSKATSTAETKYPWAKFDDGWIGRQPNIVDWGVFYQEGYEDAAFSKILEHKPLAIVDGNSPLYTSSGIFSNAPWMMGMFGPLTADRVAYEQDESTFKNGEITPASIDTDYRCVTDGFQMAFISFPLSIDSCSDVGSTRKVVLNDGFYIGHQGTCVPSTSSDNVNMSRCLAYDDSGTNRYESCLDIERRSSMEMNFFQRMMSFFFGPVLDWERSYEGLNCEMQKMQYKGWLFWGGWEDV